MEPVSSPIGEQILDQTSTKVQQRRALIAINILATARLQQNLGSETVD
jgi:hypothetical protein